MNFKWEYLKEFSIKELLALLVDFLRISIFRVLSVGPIPAHMAFIMDGNRRYARKRNLKEGAGHRVGFLALLSTIKYCYELGVKYVTVYAFSIDNFKRRPEEVQCVMDLLEEKAMELLDEENILNTYGVKVCFLGNLKLLNESTRVAAEKAMAATAHNEKSVLSICVAYTSTDEIVHSIQEVYKRKCVQIKESGSQVNCNDIVEVGRKEIDDQESPITLADIETYMYLSGLPDPDILVRTSGETRLSNFLLWQTTYCYLHCPPVLWPEITMWTLLWVILNYQRAYPYLEKKKKCA